jgi:hypothetical protein
MVAHGLCFLFALFPGGGSCAELANLVVSIMSHDPSLTTVFSGAQYPRYVRPFELYNTYVPFDTFEGPPRCNTRL